MEATEALEHEKTSSGDDLRGIRSLANFQWPSQQQQQQQQQPSPKQQQRTASAASAAASAASATGCGITSLLLVPPGYLHFQAATHVQPKAPLQGVFWCWLGCLLILPTALLFACHATSYRARPYPKPHSTQTTRTIRVPPRVRRSHCSSVQPSNMRWDPLTAQCICARFSAANVCTACAHRCVFVIAGWCMVQAAPISLLN